MGSSFSGLIAAPYTPFYSDGSLKLETVPRYVRFLQENQVDAAFVGGTTGEFASLTIEERKRLAEAWLKAADGKLRVVIHVGHTVLSEAKALAEHAADQGATAIACMAPYFFKPATLPSLVDWCARVAQSAPRLPFYYYHMPSMNGVDFPVAAFLNEVVNRIPAFAGVKFSHENLDDFAESVQLAGDRFVMMMGRDELLFKGIERGARGAVGTTYSYAAPLYRSLLEAAAAGDRERAEALQKKVETMIALCSGAGVTHLAASKTVMALLGVDCGPVRPPLIEPSSEQIAHLHAALKVSGFWDFACQPLTNRS